MYSRCFRTAVFPQSVSSKLYLTKLLTNQKSTDFGFSSYLLLEIVEFCTYSMTVTFDFINYFFNLFLKQIRRSQRTNHLLIIDRKRKWITF